MRIRISASQLSDIPESLRDCSAAERSSDSDWFADPYWLARHEAAYGSAHPCMVSPYYDVLSLFHPEKALVRMFVRFHKNSTNGAFVAGGVLSLIGDWALAMGVHIPEAWNAEKQNFGMMTVDMSVKNKRPVLPNGIYVIEAWTKSQVNHRKFVSQAVLFPFKRSKDDACVEWQSTNIKKEFSLEDIVSLMSKL